MHVDGNGRLFAGAVGRAEVRVRDAKTQYNDAVIYVQVDFVHSLQWLEERIERHFGGENGEYSLIALNAEGRKVANCSSLPVFISSPQNEE